MHHVALKRQAFDNLVQSILGLKHCIIFTSMAGIKIPVRPVGKSGLGTR